MSSVSAGSNFAGSHSVTAGSSELMTQTKNVRATGHRRRRGVTAVEFAIVAPLLFMFFFAALEFCRVAMIRHTADNAVYEGCRTGIIPGATAGEVETETRRILSALGVDKVDLSVRPKKIDADTKEVTVRVKIPLDANSFVPNQFVSGRTIVRELTLRREGN